MSQHIVCLESICGPVRVQLGWDKPLLEFYMVVFEEPPVGQEFEEDRIVYSNEDDRTSEGQELAYYKKIASSLGCEVPECMWRAVYQDREFNVVNKTVYYSPTGDVVQMF
jgi:hypothetical protein